MARAVNQKHGGTLKVLQKGETANPNGRPKKYVTLLRESGYKLSEVNDTIQTIMAMDLDELKQVWDNPKATVLEKTIANALKKSLEKGSLYSIDTLLNRVYGKPKETSQVTQDSRIEVIFTKGKTIL
jgi:tRNA A37 N6-isopentenylltransferase MiaA